MTPQDLSKFTAALTQIFEIVSQCKCSIFAKNVKTIFKRRDVFAAKNY